MELVKMNKSNDDRLNKKTVVCADGALGFMEQLAESAGDDLVYSLALENGNMFMCVTAFPSLTKKRFDINDDGLRAVFHLPEEDFKLTQDALVEKLTGQINAHLYDVREDNETE
jgi:hypothetical protein